jgi:hypothetical protein
MVDDAKVGTIRGGRTMRFPVAPGEHEVRVKYRVWVLSRPLAISIADHEEVALACETDWMGYPYVRLSDPYEIHHPPSTPIAALTGAGYLLRPLGTSR